MWQAIAEMIEKNASVIQGNCFGFVLIPLTIAQLENPLDYVLKAKTSMDRKKHSFGSQCTFYASKLLLKFFGYKVNKFLLLITPYYQEIVLSLESKSKNYVIYFFSMVGCIKTCSTSSLPNNTSPIKRSGST